MRLPARLKHSWVSLALKISKVRLYTGKYRFLAICISPILAVTLTACGAADNVSTRTNSPEKASQSAASKKCSYDAKISGLRVITSQLNAFKSANLAQAYQYASENFRSRVTLSQFSAIIGNGYPMLFNLKKFSVSTCSPLNDNYLFTVDLEEKGGVKFHLYYLLSDISNHWGVEGVQLTV